MWPAWTGTSVEAAVDTSLHWVVFVFPNPASCQPVSMTIAMSGIRLDAHQETNVGILACRGFVIGWDQILRNFKCCGPSGHRLRPLPRPSDRATRSNDHNKARARRIEWTSGVTEHWKTRWGFAWRVKDLPRISQSLWTILFSQSEELRCLELPRIMCQHSSFCMYSTNKPASSMTMALIGCEGV